MGEPLPVFRPAAPIALDNPSINPPPPPVWSMTGIAKGRFSGRKATVAAVFTLSHPPPLSPKGSAHFLKMTKVRSILSTSGAPQMSQYLNVTIYKNHQGKKNPDYQL
jgi:hypothetical protein